MKTFVIHTILFCSFNANGQSSNRSFTIIIKESAMLGGSFATITNDSIKIVSTGYSFLSDESKEIVTEFKMAMTVDEKINLAKTLKKINLKRLKRNYVGKRISYHNFEFDFIFTVDGQTKETKIYEYKHRQILNLVRLLNKYLNGKREIMYNDWYIRTFK